MHDTLFANQRALDPTSLRQYAKKLGLDAAVFEACMQSDGPKADIERDRHDGVEAGVRGTPAFVIGRTIPGSTVTGEMVIGIQSFEAVRAKIDAPPHAEGIRAENRPVDGRPATLPERCVPGRVFFRRALV